MGEDSKIEWCHHSFNPWEGCAKVSPGCKHCYAEERNKRFHDGQHWGEGAPRLMRSEAYWREPLRWHRSALERGVRERVFCASLADVFEDRADLAEPRERLFGLIAATPALDWLLLTKRPENIRRLWRAGEHPFARLPNVWLGTTAEDQQRADQRIPRLLACRHLASKLFVSYEPALGPVDFRDIVIRSESGHFEEHLDALHCDVDPEDDRFGGAVLDWVIVGGESGPHARPCDVAWIRSAREQCKIAGVACFIKQLGARPYTDEMLGGEMLGGIPLDLRDRKGGDPAEWPADLRVREVPS